MNYIINNIDDSSSRKATLGGYLVGAYLFSVPTFAYSVELNLGFIPQTLGSIVVLYALIDILLTKRLHIPYEIKLYGFFILWLMFTFLLAGELANFGSLLTSVKIGFITLGVTQLIKNERNFYNALFIYGLSIFFVAYLNYETILYLRFTDKMTGMDRFEGTLANANVAAVYAISIVWLAFLLIYRSTVKLLIKPIYIAAMSIALFIIIFSGSKKGFIGITLFVLFASWLFIQKNKSSFLKLLFTLFISLGLIVAITYLIYTSPFYYRLEHLMQITTNPASTDEDRLYLFKKAIEIWLEKGSNFFFGIGHGNFISNNSLQLYSHSTISEVLVSSGIIGFLLYFSTLGLLLKNLYVQLKFVTNTEHFISIVGSIIFVIIFLFFNATAVMYSDRQLWPLIGIIAAYSMFIIETILINENSLCNR